MVGCKFATSVFRVLVCWLRHLDRKWLFTPVFFKTRPILCSSDLVLKPDEQHWIKCGLAAQLFHPNLKALDQREACVSARTPHHSVQTFIVPSGWTWIAFLIVKLHSFPILWCKVSAKHCSVHIRRHRLHNCHPKRVSSGKTLCLPNHEVFVPKPNQTISFV